MKILARSTAGRKGQKMERNMQRNMEERAKQIARSMYNRGLQSWHVKNELEVRSIAPMYREQLGEMVTEQLEKLRSY